MAKDVDEEKPRVTVLGAETEFDGELSFSDKLVITGKFNGTIQASGDVEIAKSAVCTVEKIASRSIVVEGSVTGNLEATERIEICSGSTVIGDISTTRLRIADDVNFEGQVTMLEKEPALDLFTSASSEYRQALTPHAERVH